MKYQEIDPKYILKLWEENLNKDAHVYIHSPFCKSICKYCIYSGVPYTKEAYNYYYNEYLPEMINFYNPVLEQYNIYSWFFGGGTPTLMTPEIMKNIFSLLPNFKDDGSEKTIEIHPGIWNIEQLDILKEYNFSNIILGIQTFDIQTLKNQNRYLSTLEDAIYLADESKKRGFNLCVDVISFLNQINSDTNILKEDLENIYNYIYPEQISIQTLFQNAIDFKSKTINTLYDSKFITKENYDIENYLTRSFMDENTTKNEIIENQQYSKALRLFRKDKSGMFLNGDFLQYIICMEPSWTKSNENPNILGIGSYKNPKTQTFSCINRYSYIETNNSRPKFKLVSDG